MSQLPDKDGCQAGEKLKILVVDDEPTLRLGFAYALSNRTTTVETAATGRHALEKLAEPGAHFDLMILDLRMPELDGSGVIEELRRQGLHVPIVLCCAALQPSTMLRAIRNGVVDFLLKPVRPVDLRHVAEFITHPGTQPFPRAMKAVREHRLADAIRILDNEPDDHPQAAPWLGVLKSIRDMNINEEAASLTEQLRAGLPALAFNAQ